ncbi:hypothetical protein GE061_003105 [Apolygus lucorum]|uniref:dihydropyrimidinase n=1 Tax=Apolygus lucorum TaxID=248454 RepID=A0A6A4KDM0_APOLU|nr:hypothetical protein GE061_003105 [Apolygus lucorum]
MLNGHPLLIRNGTIVNADSTLMGDVLLMNGKIADVGREIEQPRDCGVIDAKGKYVIPGGLDTNTLLEGESNGMRPKDDFYHGTRAGVAGGTTMVIDLVLPRQGESPLGAFLDWKNKSEKKAVCDFTAHVGITWWGPQVAQDMETLATQYGVLSFKMFMAGENMMNDSELYNAFKTCERLKCVPLVHAENGMIIKENVADLLKKGISGPEGHGLARSENIEAEATNRACVIAENVGSKLYVSPVMSESAAGMISLWKKAGNSGLVGETIAAALGMTFSPGMDYDKAAALITSPPVRSSSSTPGTLMMRLAGGDLAIVGSGNCSYDRAQKGIGKNNFTLIPHGVNGLEDRMSIVWTYGVETGILSPQQFVAVTSKNAAQIFNLYPKKGCISVGSDADIVVWDGRLEKVISSRTHHHNNDVNIFEGVKVKGNPDHVIVKGRLCYSDRELSTVKGWGEFVPRGQSQQQQHQQQQVMETSYQNISTPIPMEPTPVSSPCDDLTKPGGDYLEQTDVSGFIEPKTLNFQEKRCAIEAMKKICSRVNLTLAVIFKNYDKNGSSEISKADFQIILSKVCGVSALSNREIDAIVKGYGTGDSIKYVDFLRACEYLFCAKRQPY